ncbi:hypothetical protein SEA_SIXAMA_58 [Gordonia phage Sixama]|uniref:Uncharacterized protein n=1 Tax=Gordonia phage Sixama TaxID=2653271 RepID=A0A5Q2F422_9CAUD|nr:hypothetical protein PP302_gp058 [Gordonia phage Sixama]QGF20237.1 hypothetical protein SEA_SIXAMA_58 [Gordonia phage Sixama]
MANKDLDALKAKMASIKATDYSDGSGVKQPDAPTAMRATPRGMTRKRANTIDYVLASGIKWHKDKNKMLWTATHDGFELVIDKVSDRSYSWSIAQDVTVLDSGNDLASAFWDISDIIKKKLKGL